MPNWNSALIFTEPMFREFASFLVEKYEAIVIDAGRWISDEVVLAALQSSSAIFLVITQEFPSIRNAQRYIGALMRLGFNQDQIKIVVNAIRRSHRPNLASLEQIQQTLNQPVFYGIPSSPAVLAAVNRGRPFVADRASRGRTGPRLPRLRRQSHRRRRQAAGEDAHKSMGSRVLIPDPASGADRWFEIKTGSTPSC